MMMNAMAHHAPMDWHSLPEDGVDHTAGLEDGVKHLRIAYSGDLGFSHVDPEIAAGCRRAIDVFRDAGASVEETDPGFPDPYGWFTDLWRGLSAEGSLDMEAGRRDKLGDKMRETSASGASLSLEAYMRARRSHAIPATDLACESPFGGRGPPPVPLRRTKLLFYPVVVRGAPFA